MKILALLLAIAGFAAAAPGLDSPQPIGGFLNGVFPTTTPGPTGSWAVADAFPNLTFVDPVRIEKDPLSQNHIYVVCRNGEIWRIPFSSTATNSDKVRVLDRRANTWGYWDAGMMSLTFHPEFGQPGSPNRRYVYVFYQYIPQANGNTSPSLPSYMRLSRFTVPDGQVAFDPASEYVLIQQYDRHNWHNGGQAFFGPEGFLYVVIGDEGAANDSYDVGQKINERMFAGILRIDVDNDLTRSHPIRRQPLQISMPSGWAPSFTQGYSIPNDNPFLDPNGGVLEEFWSIGTRSPHSMHFDDETGEIWIAEVGQGTREEITVAIKGGNHQWPYKEGFANGPKAKPANIIGTEVPPVYDYPRSMGGCIIGGIVYRGQTHLGSLGGKYLFGDHNTRALYALTRNESGPPTIEYLTSVNRSGGTKRGLAGISEGPDGEAYFMELGDTGTNTGKILKLVRNGTPIADPPRWLSQTGTFTNLANLTPRSGLIPYSVNSPLWTDGAAKQRWIAIPNNGTHDTPAEQVTYRETGAWNFPPGTVLVKHFALPIDARDPSIVKPVETRFFVHGSDGAYYGVTYRWNEQGTDAELLTDGASRDFTVTEADGSTRTQRWDIPSRSDCRTCHTTQSDNVLGLRSHQLNGPTLYPTTGRLANQLETWHALGIFGSSFGSRNPDTLPKSVDPQNPHASLDHRVRSYLDANCAHCHHPDGVTANFDASFHTPLSTQNLVEGAINRPLNGAADRVVKPGDPARSLIHLRPSLVGGGQMPPLGKNLVDENAVALIEDWIRSLDNASFQFTGSPSPGILGEYYNGRNFETKVLTRTDNTIDFNWGNASPATGINTDNFSVVWSGFITPTATGLHSFHATTDDGVRLTINGTRIIDAWVDRSPTESTATISLTAGVPVTIRMEYFENAGGAVATLAWTPPGSSKSIIPASAFSLNSGANTPPVANNDNLTGTHRSSTTIDPLVNDSDANAPPGIHGITITHPPSHGTIRISGAQKRLIYTHNGSSSRSDSFTYTLTDPQGAVSSPATITLAIPYDFAAWAAETPGATGNPAANSDGDLYQDLLEFALGGLPNSGNSPAPRSLEILADGQSRTLLLQRPAALSGITYTIETSPDLTTWTTAGSPANLTLQNGIETLSFTNLQSRPGLSPENGFVRLRVSRQGDSASFTTLPLGWLAASINSSRTLGVPFRETPVFSSLITATNGLDLTVIGTPDIPLNFRGYIEVLAGPHTGHRFEISGTSQNTITLAPTGPHTLTPIPSLTGSRIALIPHHQLAGIFEKSRFKGSTNPAAADQLQILVNDGTAPAAFELFYLLDARPANQTHQWRAFLPGGGSQDTRTLPPGQGVFLKRPAGAPSTSLLLTGQVRGNPFARPLHPGVNLASHPFPLPLSPQQAGLLNPTSSFLASTNLNAADQFHLHQSGVFRIFYLLDHPSQPDFWREAIPSSPNSNSTPLFLPSEAVFLKRSAPAPQHLIPLPWNP